MRTNIYAITFVLLAGLGQQSLNAQQYNIVWTSQSSNSGEVGVLLFFCVLLQ